ncbi:hypothetical protein TYRP_016863 [Tyrophagus putrescentiae]|nr:hypothetical protein TYRP_016863 [Tyrophagus putrescentiae]
MRSKVIFSRLGSSSFSRTIAKVSCSRTTTLSSRDFSDCRQKDGRASMLASNRFHVRRYLFTRKMSSLSLERRGRAVSNGKRSCQKRSCRSSVRVRRLGKAATMRGNIKGEESSPSNRKRGRIFVLKGENGELLAGIFGFAFDHSQRLALAVLAGQAHQTFFGLLVKKVTRLGFIIPRAGEPGWRTALEQSRCFLAAPVRRAQSDKVDAGVSAKTLRRRQAGEGAGEDALFSQFQRFHLNCALCWRLEVAHIFGKKVVK